jgi:pseudaminic acid biosynthesis-associated methylase
MRKATEQLTKWKDDFGRKYTDRNTLSPAGLESLYKKNYGIGRVELNKLFLGKISRSARVLEVGSNVGNQLLCLKDMGFKNLHGVEPQGYAVEYSKKRARGVNIVQGDAFDLPFEDGCFDIVFTSGVLIHIHPENIEKAIREIYRCSGGYIWGFEYYAPRHTEIIYRGRKNLLWKADFKKIYLDTFPDLKPVKEKKVKYLDSGNVDEMFLLRKTK